MIVLNLNFQWKIVISAQWSWMPGAGSGGKPRPQSVRRLHSGEGGVEIPRIPVILKKENNQKNKGQISKLAPETDP